MKKKKRAWQLKFLLKKTQKLANNYSQNVQNETTLPATYIYTKYLHLYINFETQITQSNYLHQIIYLQLYTNYNSILINQFYLQLFIYLQHIYTNEKFTAADKSPNIDNE